MKAVQTRAAESSGGGGRWNPTEWSEVAGGLGERERVSWQLIPDTESLAEVELKRHTAERKSPPTGRLK